MSAAATPGEVSGVILVGGKSQRMGEDKAFIPINGKPVVEGVIDLFRRSFSRLLLVGDRPERFAGYGIDVLPDICPGSALGGIYTALYHAGTEYVFVASCDMPFPSQQLVDHFCKLRHGYDAVIPSTDMGYEPLFALYSRNCLQPIHRQLMRKEFCAHAYFPQIRACYVHDDELAAMDPGGRGLFNLNTTEDLQRCLQGVAS